MNQEAEFAACLLVNGPPPAPEAIHNMYTINEHYFICAGWWHKNCNKDGVDLTYFSSWYTGFRKFARSYGAGVTIDMEVTDESSDTDSRTNSPNRPEFTGVSTGVGVGKDGRADSQVRTGNPSTGAGCSGAICSGVDTDSTRRRVSKDMVGSGGSEVESSSGVRSDSGSGPAGSTGNVGMNVPVEYRRR